MVDWEQWSEEVNGRLEALEAEIAQLKAGGGRSSGGGGSRRSYGGGGGEFRMPFGKHKGKPLNRVPIGYLRWLWSSHNDPAEDFQMRDDLYGGTKAILEAEGQFDEEGELVEWEESR